MAAITLEHLAHSYLPDPRTDADYAAVREPFAGRRPEKVGDVHQACGRVDHGLLEARIAVA